ncbi:MAG: hypothetical protein C0625_04835 [Arcobacter sp.]|nr:MAG: hypothetical protein C0625_04835 [Arcobacter sp.]
MRTKNTIISFAKVFFITNLCLIIYSMVFHNLTWMLNTQVAFIGSLLITIASFISYKKNIQNRLSNMDTSKSMTYEDRDKVDEIDDPYDLYTEYEEILEEELTPEKIKEIIQDEKSKVKKNTFKNTLFSVGGFVSIYRIIGYGFLIFGFFALNNNKLFLPIPFLVGLGVVPLSVLAAKFVFNTTLKSEEDQ